MAKAVRDAKAGQVQFRVDKAGIVHATIGRRSFESDKLTGNLRALIDALNKSKPATSKGVYLRKVAVSSTMGVGVRVDTASLAADGLSFESNAVALVLARRGKELVGCALPQGARRSSKTAGVAAGLQGRSPLNRQAAAPARASADGGPAGQDGWLTRGRRHGQPGFLEGQVADVRCAPGPQGRKAR